jgi:DNA invertase Pin-like site-specific DNA recombinase
MKFGYARVSPGGKSESVEAQARQLTKAGCKKVFRDVHVSGAKTDRAPLRRVIEALEPGNVLMVTRLDRLARSTRDLLNTLAAITAKKAGFKSLGDTWADTTASHGRLMLTVLGGLAEFERDLIRARTGEGRARAVARGQKMGRPFKLTDHQKHEAIKRREQGETLADIARSYTSVRRRFHDLESNAQLAGQGKAALDTLDRDFPCCGGRRGRGGSRYSADLYL